MDRLEYLEGEVPRQEDEVAKKWGDFPSIE